MSETQSLKATVTGRLLGGAVWKPKENAFDADKSEYSACVILDEGQDAKIHAIRDAAIAAEFGDKPPKVDDWTVREGDDEEYELSLGKKYINPKSKKNPIKTIVKRGGKVIDVVEEDDLIYPGADIAISVSAYAYKGDKQKGIKPGVTLNARAILFLKHNDRLSDTVNDSEFDDLESIEDGEFDDNEDWGD